MACTLCRGRGESTEGGDVLRVPLRAVLWADIPISGLHPEDLRGPASEGKESFWLLSV